MRTRTRVAVFLPPPRSDRRVEHAAIKKSRGGRPLGPYTEAHRTTGPLIRMRWPNFMAPVVRCDGRQMPPGRLICRRDAISRALYGVLLTAPGVGALRGGPRLLILSGPTRMEEMLCPYRTLYPTISWRRT